MKISTRYSDAIHILAYLNIYHQTKLSSENIAASVMTSPVVVRRIMAALQKAGIITTVQGSPKPGLAKDPDEINLLDVYYAVEGDRQLFAVDEKTNPQCIVGGNIQKVLGNYYQEVQNAALGRLARITLGDVIDDILVAQKKKEAE
ncbi:Rrf2 family transcriptional regulator [uncultured Limosilactobacillus sp.]|uniref:Rrf2 family transcriptional regulator n=1 Tax=uncultured Limosilactobacillus sp. TaxID=2837629 RepID=UPI0025F47AAB|nr:Rrf2 family transcriptional regulator [uncultured Limosilactobacillus sp.]